MEKPGVIAAGQFTADGKVERAVGDISSENMGMIAMVCTANSKHLEKQAEIFEEKLGMEWMPMNGWIVWAGKYAVCVVGNTGVFVEAKRADFNQLMVDLLGSTATGEKPARISGI
jgi:roadblock/LC7 domain-containing protein